MTTLNKEAALNRAKEQGIDELTDDHWKVIQYLHDYYTKYDLAPMVRTLLKETGITLKRLYELFPAGPAKGACFVAGLPKSQSCV